MKYVIMIGDGMAGEALPDLKNQTTLEAANTPAMDYLASIGTFGLTCNVPKGMPPGSDVATMSILGYDPAANYPGRAPLEAMAMGVELDEEDVAFRCNLVTIHHHIMESFTAHHISNNESRFIISTLNEELGSDAITFYPGVSYRNLCVIKNGPFELDCTPPHDISDQAVDDYLPKGDRAKEIIELMNKSREIIQDIETKATQIWLWGQGFKPDIKPLTSEYNFSGSVITAVDLLKGIGVAAGLTPIHVEGATGFVDTNYKGKLDAAINELSTKDMVLIHLEAPDESGHLGDYKLKIQAIEDFDKLIVKPLFEELKEYEEYKLIVLPDHPTPIRLKTHTDDPVPFVYIDSKNTNKPAQLKFNEKDAKTTGVLFEKGHKLIRQLFFEDY
jgi:2,3-bisphosphoglycerate-independent phosphoglycerate mutase